MQGPIYLDWNATAPARPAVIAAVESALAETGNPSSVHSFGRRARARVETAREQVAALVGARPDQVVFTSGGTEANNLALAGSGARRRIVSAIEHDSVLQAAPDASCLTARLDGVVDLGTLAERLDDADPPGLLSLMMANNETGVIQPLSEAAATARVAGWLIHTDAVQAAGRMAIDLERLGVDLLTLSAHKIGGPPGVGALVVGDRVTLEAAQRGGGQERGRRAGTENVAAIAGFGVAADCARAELGGAGTIAALRDEMERRIAHAVPSAVIFGRDAPRLPNTSCIALPGLASETQVMALDLAGVAVSAGAACSSGRIRSSHVLRAMGIDEATASCAIRVSLGRQTTIADIDSFLAAWVGLAVRQGVAPPLAQTAA